MRSLSSVGVIAVLGLVLCPTAPGQQRGAVAAPAPHTNVAISHPHHFPASSNRDSHPAYSRKSGVAGATNNLTTSTSSSNPKVTVAPADTSSSLEEFTGLGPPINLNNLGESGTDGNLGVEALINPVTQANLALASRLSRTGVGTGAYLLGGGYGYYPTEYDQSQSEPQQAAADAPAAPQPQVIIIQQPGPANAPPADPPHAEEIAPQPEPTSPLTLVLKNGSQIQAVAFTRQGNQIVYITGSGSRSTVAVAEVDAAATAKLNDDRGTPLNLSL